MIKLKFKNKEVMEEEAGWLKGLNWKETTPFGEYLIINPDTLEIEGVYGYDNIIGTLLKEGKVGFVKTTGI